jgi:glycosyltransferase involved in cell wall biosynthesis
MHGETDRRPCDRSRQTARLLYVAESNEILERDAIFASLRRRNGVVLPWTITRRTQQPKVMFATRRALVADEVANLIRFLVSPRLYRGRWVIVAATGHYSSLALARVRRLMRRETRVVLYNFYLHGLGKRRLVQWALHALLGPHVRVICQTADEVRYFQRIRRDAILDHVPYCQGPLMPRDWIGEGDYIFAGGYTNRDYELLLRCAACLPEEQFVVACSTLNKLAEPVPANVRIVREEGWESFHRSLGHSKIVVVPLREPVGASGQMVTLAAMESGKPTVVPHIGGLDQYIVHGETGLMYRLGDERSLLEVLTSCVADPEVLKGLGRAARARFLDRFVRERFEEAVVERVRADAAAVSGT